MKNIRILIIILAIIKFAFPFVLQNGGYEPHRDEFLYLEQANHLDWGYLENPPLLSAFAYLTKLMGNTLLWIKIWPALFGAGTYYLTAEIAVAFGGKKYAVFLVFLAYIFSAFLRIHFLLQPNFLDIFFSTAMALTLVKYVQSNKNYWLYLFGLSAGLGVLGKYSAGFYLIALLLGLLFSKQARVYINIHFYLALLLAAAIIAPNYYWQYMHNFPVWQHLKELQETQLQFISPSQFISEQFLMLLPVFYLWIMGFLYLLFTKRGLHNFMFILSAYVFTICFLLWKNGKGYYALNAYPALIAVGAYNFDRITRKYIKILRYSLITFTVVLGIMVVALSIPFLPPKELSELYETRNITKTGVLKWEDQQNHPLPQDFADMIGWREITDRILRIYNTFTDEQKAHTLILADNYGVAGALNYFGKSKGLPFANNDHSSFTLWLPDTVNINTILLLAYEPRKADDAVFKHFKVADQMDDINIHFAREQGLKIILYGNPDGHQNEAIKEVVALRKQVFIRNQNTFP